MRIGIVSPALFPLIFGAAMILLAIAIFSFAMKNGGMAALKSSVAALKGTRVLSDANIRYAAVLVALLSMVYVNLKWSTST
jgi:hypothetical protein